jgi:hypothetical protein
MAAMTLSTSLAGQALGLSSNALAAKVNVGEARVSMKGPSGSPWYCFAPPVKTLFFWRFN